MKSDDALTMLRNILMGVLILAAILAIWAILLMLAWGWFVTPVLGREALSFTQAFGLSLALWLFFSPVVLGLNNVKTAIDQHAKALIMDNMMRTIISNGGIKKKPWEDGEDR